MGVRITSPQNPRIKFALSLRKASARKKEHLFIIEGQREIRLAIQSGFRFHTLFFCPEIAEKSNAAILIGELKDQIQTFETTRDIFNRLVYREGSDGLLVIAHQKEFAPGDIKLSGNPLVLVVEGVEKPGNLGAIFRTADAARVDAVIVCGNVTDIFNPNVVRASLGTIFTVPVVLCTSEEAVGLLKNLGLNIYTTALSASVPYHVIDYRVPCAIVLGAEDTGVTAIWQNSSDSNIFIPMFGKADSMNVSVVTSIVLYEALRQRGFHDREFSIPKLS
jgi:RNA methyltransferase, TrmH family